MSDPKRENVSSVSKGHFPVEEGQARNLMKCLLSQNLILTVVHIIMDISLTLISLWAPFPLNQNNVIKLQQGS